MQIDEEILKEIVGLLIQEKREKAGFTREAFSREINKSPNTLYFIEKGGPKQRGGKTAYVRHQVSLTTFIEVADGLGISADKLLNQVLERYKKRACSHTKSQHKK